jgi:hypothetical protein
MHAAPIVATIGEGVVRVPKATCRPGRQLVSPTREETTPRECQRLGATESP